MRELLRIKQILTIPKGYTVLTPIESEESEKNTMEDFSRKGWSYMIALVDGGEWDDDYVTFYEIDPCGLGELCNNACMVPKSICPHCDSEMIPYMDSDDHNLYYKCSCGCRSINALKQ